MLSLYKKNIRILLSSVSMWISVILFLVINGFATAYFNIDNGFVYYGYTISNTIMGYVIIIPVLCMNAQKLTGSHTLKNIHETDAVCAAHKVFYSSQKFPDVGTKNNGLYSV